MRLCTGISVSFFSTSTKRVTPFADPHARFRAGRFGMGVFLVSLAMLFIGGLLGYLVIWLQTQPWPTSIPPLPASLWLSTAILLLSSLTMHLAVRGAREDRQAMLRAGMLLTTYLGIAFLLIQSYAWITWLEPVSRQWSKSNDFRFALAGFFVLTGIHAAHVIGGLVPLIITTRHAFRGLYSSERNAGIHYAAMYWHFLDAVWLVLFATLKLTVG